MARRSDDLVLGGAYLRLCEMALAHAVRAAEANPGDAEAQRWAAELGDGVAEAQRLERRLLAEELG